MIAGSSNIHNIGLTNLASPSIQLLMKENSYLQQVGMSVAGASIGTFAQTPYLADSIMFKDLLIYAKFAGVSRFNLLYYGISANNITALQSTSIDVGVSNITQFSRLTNTGNTLMLYIMGNIGNTQYMYSVSSSGGTVWGNTDVIFSTVKGGLNLFPGTSDIFLGIAPVGSTRVYFNFYNFTIYGALAHVGLGGIGVFSKVAGNWGLTILNLNNLQITYNASSFNLSAANLNNEDILLLQCTDSATVGGNNEIGGIKIIRTDGVNIFEDRNLIDISNSKAFTSMSNLSKGPTLYYLATNQVLYNSSVQAGITQIIYNITTSIVYSSLDLLNWNAGVYIPTNYGTSVGKVVTASRVNSIAAGSTDIEYILMGNSSVAFLSSKVQSSLDLSQDIVTYSNQNNQRINLTIGNYGSS